MNRKKEFHVIVRSRNISCRELRNIKTNKRVIYRMGSETPTTDITRRNDYIEINSPEACKISGNKKMMKECFVSSEVPTAEYISFDFYNNIEEATNILLEKLAEWKRMIIKHVHSSRGNGIFFVDNEESLREWINEHNVTHYIFERYYTYSKEYRLHVNNEGCFYTCRKMLKSDAEDRWHRHESNSVWILEDNELFDKPDNWDDIVQSCIDAKNSVGLDIAAVDVKVQTHVENPKYIILETNSAPALGSIGIIKYSEMLKNYISNH